MKKINLLTLLLLLFMIKGVFASSLHSGGNRHTLPEAVRDSAKKDTVASDSTEEDKNRLFAIGAEFASDQEQYGLHNKNVKIPYIEPSFTYTAPKGFYVEVEDEYVLRPAKIQGFDLLSANPGWNIDLSDYTTLNFNYNRYFTKNTPDIIKSNESNTLETFIYHWIGNLRGEFTVDYDIYKGNNSPNDFVFTPDLEYKFKWKFGKKSSLKIKPEASVDIGSRNFYTQYEKAQEADSTSEKLKPKKTTSSTENSSFGTLDYNLILTIVYAVGKFEFEPAFTYTDPLYNPSDLSNPPTAIFTFSVTYTISTK